MKYTLYLLLAIIICSCGTSERVKESASSDTTLYSEPYRPQVHFSPKENWMNDPNGMVYYNNEYHLFYQHYPDSNVWGPMHWGHAVSKDLVHWTHLPIALYPDSLGLIFSGSAIVDENNTSGFGTKENPPLVAIYTYHSMEKEKAGATDFQNQGIAFSNDGGNTWTKYEKNPVLRNQGIKDFRDPKVFWHEQTAKWIMILAVKDHIELWNSSDLKAWSKLSDFGIDYGAHGGVWECPDLFELKVEGEEQNKWVMLVSINPGGPNGGSATQYFIGDFDGRVFKPDTDKQNTKWIDHGPDNYAGVTWSNVADGRRIFLGWMSNWAYAQVVPTVKWRSAMTVPRDLSLIRVGKEVYIKSRVVPEFVSYANDSKELGLVSVDKTLDLEARGVTDAAMSVISGSFDAKDFTMKIANSKGQHLTIRYDATGKVFLIDRSNAGRTDFSKDYPHLVSAPRVLSEGKINIKVVLDVSSVEVFFDDGVTVLTSIFFPDEPLSKISISSSEGMQISDLTVKPLKSIWK